MELENTILYLLITFAVTVAALIIAYVFMYKHKPDVLKIVEVSLTGRPEGSDVNVVSKPTDSSIRVFKTNLYCKTETVNIEVFVRGTDGGFVLFDLHCPDASTWRYKINLTEPKLELIETHIAATIGED